MENRRKLAIATLCRAYLNIHGFITPAENRRVSSRILKWGWKNKVSISEAQLDSADFVYNDNAKEEEE
jgi:hypothetical protein|nr:MAG TPA: hypothetical protein [Bacteriophage sp.]